MTFVGTNVLEIFIPKVFVTSMAAVFIDLCSLAVRAGRYKTWTLDSGLDSELDYGLDYGLSWTVNSVLELLFKRRL